MDAIDVHNRNLGMAAWQAQSGDPVLLIGLDRSQPARRFDPEWRSQEDLQDMYDADSADA